MNDIRVASPCEVAWNDMAGDDRVRHCSLCSLNVYNFAELSRDEIRALLARTEGRICGRLYRRADGTLLTRDCPAGLAALRRRASRFAAAVIAALFSVSAFAAGKTCEKPRTMGSVRLVTERVVPSQRPMFMGKVQDPDGNALPGVTVVLKDEATQRESTTVTDANGAFTIAVLSDGVYRVDVSLEGFEPAGVEHLLLKQGETTRANVMLRTTAVMGIIVVSDPIIRTSDGPHATFSQELIRKLPL